MRSTLIAVIGSLVLALSTVMAAPVDVEAKAKAKWPKVWDGGQRSFVSKPFVVANRPGTDTQHQWGVLVVRKKPGRDTCVARLKYHQQWNAGPWNLRLETKSRRPQVQAFFWQFDMTDAPKKVRMQVRIKTNGKCKWSFALSGPRKGQAPEMEA